MGFIAPHPVVAYSDTEWSSSEHPPLVFSKGLRGCAWFTGGCLGTDAEYCVACALATPEEVANALAPRSSHWS